MNFPQYQVIQILSLQTVQLPNETIASGTTIFVLEQQTLATGSWGAATFGATSGIPAVGTSVNLNSLQAYNNPPDVRNMYIVGMPWVDAPSAQAAAISDFTRLTGLRDGAVTQAQLQLPIGNSAFVNVISTVAGPG